MIGKKLKDLMDKHSIMTISELAKRTMIAKSVLHGYLQDSEPSLRNLVKLCDYFEVTLDQILGREKYNEIMSKNITAEESVEYIVTIHSKPKT